MTLLQILSKRAKTVGAPLIGGLVIAYFGYYAVQGDRGLLAYMRLNQEIRKAEVTKELLAGERDSIERRVRLLRPDSMDPDMLDERVRLMLGVGRPDETLVMLQRSETPPPVISKQ